MPNTAKKMKTPKGFVQILWKFIPKFEQKVSQIYHLLRKE